MTDVVRDALYRLTAKSLPYLPNSLLREVGESVTILAMHGLHIADRSNLSPPPSSVELTSFVKNLEVMLSASFTFVSIDRVLQAITGEVPLGPRAIALTFDDSLKCHRDLAVPALTRLGVPGTFYLSTDALDDQQPYWWLRLDYLFSALTPKVISLTRNDGSSYRFHMTGERGLVELKSLLRNVLPDERAQLIDQCEVQVGRSLLDTPHEYPYADTLSWDDASAIAQAGMTVGSHSVSHCNLAIASGDELVSETCRSKQRLEAILKTRCDHFCFPYGCYSEQAIEAVHNAGYLSAVTSDAPGWNHVGGNPNMLKRFAFPKQAFKLPYVVSGIEARVRRIRRKFR